MYSVRRPPDVSDVARRLLLSRRPALSGPVPYQHSPGVGTAPARSATGVGGRGGGYAPPDPFDPSGDAARMTREQLDPILAYITQRFGAQASGVSNAFGQLTNEYSGALKGYAGEVPGMFAGPEGIVKGAAKGIKHQLVELGKSTQAGQDAATSFAGLPQGAGAEDIPLKKIGKGSGGAAYAIGGAALDALRAEQATAEKYAGQLPGFAQLEGQANTRSVLSRLAGEMADQLAQTTAEAPKLYYQIYNDLQDRAANDRNFAEQVREFDAQQNAATAKSKASMAGPQAPTLAGRQAYWDSVAADRTKQKGILYVGTTTGIRPVDADPSKPGIQPSVTLQGAAATRVGAPVTKTSGGYIYQYDPDTGAWTKVAGTGPKPTAPKQPTNTGPYYRNPTTGKWDLKPGYKITNGTVTKTATPSAKTTVSGSAPRRVAPGKWVSRSGKPLSAAGNAYWENQWKQGRTDGHGSLKPPPKKTGGGGSGFDPASGKY